MSGEQSEQQSHLATGVEMLDFFHRNLSRHHAETLLMHNACEGTYLLRSSYVQTFEYVLSVRCKGAVSHFPVRLRSNEGGGKHISFGQLEFESGEDLAAHLARSPLIAGEAGVPTVLCHAYPSHIAECSLYDKVLLHAETVDLGSAVPSSHAPHLEVGSKAGYLTKQGGVVKNWKVRWFVLEKDKLAYYKNQDSKEPIRTLELSTCSAVALDSSAEKANCLRLVFPSRTFYICGQTQTDTSDWLQVLSFKLKSFEKTQ